MQMNIQKITYLKCRETYEDMADRCSYAHNPSREEDRNPREKSQMPPAILHIYTSCCNQIVFGKPFMTKYQDYGYYCLKSNLIQLNLVTFAFLFCRHCLESSLYSVLLWQLCCRSSPLSSP